MQPNTAVVESVSMARVYSVFQRIVAVCRYLSVGYCVDRINSNTPNGTMKVAVAGILRATGQGQLWGVISNPVFIWFQSLARKLKGEPPVHTPFEDLPEWWKKLPDSNLRGAENYYK